MTPPENERMHKEREPDSPRDTAPPNANPRRSESRGCRTKTVAIFAVFSLLLCTCSVLMTIVIVRGPKIKYCYPGEDGKFKECTAHESHAKEQLQKLQKCGKSQEKKWVNLSQSKVNLTLKPGNDMNFGQAKIYRVAKFENIPKNGLFKVKGWVPSGSRNVDFKDGSLIVKKAGLYLVYVQLHFWCYENHDLDKCQHNTNATVQGSLRWFDPRSGKEKEVASSTNTISSLKKTELTPALIAAVNMRADDYVFVLVNNKKLLNTKHPPNSVSISLLEMENMPEL